MAVQQLKCHTEKGLERSQQEIGNTIFHYRNGSPKTETQTVTMAQEPQGAQNITKLASWPHHDLNPGCFTMIYPLPPTM